MDPAQISGDMGSFYVRKESYHSGTVAKVFSGDPTPAHPRKPGKCEGSKFHYVHPHGRKDTHGGICLSISCERPWEAVSSSPRKRTQIREKENNF